MCVTKAAFALALAVSASAFAAPFVAYHDLGAPATTTANVTNTGVNGTVELKDFTTGTGTGVTLAVGGVATVDTFGAMSVAGTDAANLFPASPTLNYGGIISYLNADPAGITFTLTGLDPETKYDLALFANRDRSDYTARTTKYTLESAAGFVNSSSTGTTISGASTTLSTGNNGTNGYLVRYTEVLSGVDGTITLRAERGTAGQNWYGGNALRLEATAVPEPAALAVLGLASSLLMARRRRA